MSGPLAMQIRRETGGGLPWATAKVTAVSTHAVTLLFRGAAITAPYLSSYSPTVNDIVNILHGGGQILVLGKSA